MDFSLSRVGHRSISKYLTESSFRYSEHLISSYLGTMIVLLLCLAILQGPTDTVRTMFWNVENLFDSRADSTSVSELEFSSRGARHWTYKRFKTKCNAIAKATLYAASEFGGAPDVIGFAEVENARVLRHLTEETALRKLGYKALHFESADKRGIDVALLYRPSRLSLIGAKACHILADDGKPLATRDILLATFRTPDGKDLALLVNHHPSKFGGAASGSRRKKAMERLRSLADSLIADGYAVLAMGDMNDTPDNPVFQLMEPTLKNLAKELHSQGEGTIFYDGKWELIDMFFASPGLKTSKMKIIRIPFLMTRDSKHAVMKPLRTYNGPRYLGGVSDHCPIWIDLY